MRKQSSTATQRVWWPVWKVEPQPRGQKLVLPLTGWLGVFRQMVWPPSPPLLTQGVETVDVMRVVMRFW